MVGSSSSRITATGGYLDGYSDRRVVDQFNDVGDDDDDEQFYAGLGFPTTTATDTDTGEGGAVSDGSKVVLAGKRVIEVDEVEEVEGFGIRKRVKIALQQAGIGDEDDDDEDDRVGVEEMDVDSDSGVGAVLKVPTTLGKGNPRRRFYFEDAYSSGEEEGESGGEESEEEPTALLTVRQHKEAANTIRRLKHAALKDPTIVAPEKKSRGKTLAPVNEPYRELLNEAIRDARTRTVYPDEHFPASEVCGVPWSSGEKERFFRALPRVGRYNAVGLAEEVRSKSVIEVQGYLDVLKNQLERRLMANQRSRFQLLLGEDIPAAVEVGEECETALDEEAERMRGYLEKLEEKENKGKWDGGDAVSLEMALETERKEGEVCGELEAKKERLFDLVTWLRLSERIFMASVYEGKLGSSAIHKQTLEDLETLVISITRRVVQVIIFQANSRLQNAQTHHKKSREVVCKDVLAALQMLGMPINSEEYWRRLPRKLGLRVIGSDSAIEKKGKGEKPTFLEYDVVEEKLKVFEDLGFYTNSIKGGKDRRLDDGEEDERWETDEEDEVNYNKDAPEEEELSNSQEDEDDEDEDEEQEEATEDEEPRNGNGRITASDMASYLDTPIHLESFLHAPPIKALKPRQRKDILDELHYINKDEKYLNAVDKLHSKLEEKRLWRILGGWKGRKEKIKEEIKDLEKKIPEEPNLRVFRRLQKWKRDDWRQEAAGPVVPIWQQRYYRKLLDRERVIRIKKKKTQTSDEQGNGGDNVSDESNTDSEDGSGVHGEDSIDESMSSSEGEYYSESN
ncbi:hypothetical protein AOL_s00109g34 [Orbilia oligospora ATCC 24927]|uniref:Myb-like domain-containing protein n=2 Tax=Orbilia oligospora TaxID=2813651 RepID=G1XK05_ARTOA|nr:hypothetical protein AOL_s00109g34 [Orbilia oligospora ATCC 24927]EGX46462.1 hypothetical protein AOL_s00109g34 [Orbilia oligospora ATCC 24927]KAF3289807.1 hypothetical protein TWF970_003563 [Orbilia oligospora]